MRGFLTGCLLSIVASSAVAQQPSVRIQVIDVGQADGILVRTPDTTWVLIDAGQDGLLADSPVTQALKLLQEQRDVWFEARVVDEPERFEVSE